MKTPNNRKWQNIFLEAGSEKGLGDLSMMISTVSEIITREQDQSAIDRTVEAVSVWSKKRQYGWLGIEEDGSDRHPCYDEHYELQSYLKELKINQ